jgi:prolyl oligopeptidase
MKKFLTIFTAAAMLQACPKPQTENPWKNKPPEEKPVENPQPDPINKPDPKPEEPKAAWAKPYPFTRAEAIEDTIFGVKVKDPYRWLEDVKSAEVQSWMNEQDSYTRKELAKLPNREWLEKRLKELYYVESIGVPTHKGNYKKGPAGTVYFYTKRGAGQEKSIVYVKSIPKKGDPTEKAILDPSTLSKDGTVALGTWVPSKDGKKIAYAQKKNNADEATLYVRDVETGEDSKIDIIEGAKYASPQWTPKGDGFYYTYLPTDPNIKTEDRPGYAEVRYHQLGTDPKTDVTVYEKTGDPTKFVDVSLSGDGRWLFVYIFRGWSATDIYVRDLKNKKDTSFKPFIAGKEAVYGVVAWKDKFYIYTNEGAPNGKIMVADAKKPDQANWKELIPEDKNAVVDTDNAGFQLLGGSLVGLYLKNASSEIRVYDLKGKLLRTQTLPEIGAVSTIRGNEDEDEAYFSFNSFTRPTEIHKLSIKKGTTELWASAKLPIDSSKFTVKQEWFASKDGTKVSMFIVHKRDAVLDGSMPFLLYGYGGFNVNMLPSFSSGLYPWLEAGGGYAVPNLRGGAEYGEEWHKAGWRDKKQNVFDDFIGAAQHLIDKKYTSSSVLAIRGGSNGGLLTGTATVQRPDLFGAVICGVPLLDMVRYTKYGSGKTWIDEYGDPDKEADFKWLYAYSPYHKIKEGTKYPAFLMMAADSDDRVDPFHSRKYTAAMQAATSNDRPVLIRIEKNAGHGGADLVKQTVASSVDMYSFLMSQFKMSAPK